MAENHNMLRIAIVGLGLSRQNELKQHILGVIPDFYLVNWCAINEPDINLLLIDSNFYESPSIQKVILRHRSHVLKIISHSKFPGLLQDNELHLPVESSSMFKQWIESILLGVPEKSSDVKYVGEQEKVIDFYSHKISFTEDNKNSPTDDVNENFFNQILDRPYGKIIIFNHHTALGVADTCTELMWPAYLEGHTLLNVNVSLNFTHAKASTVSELHKVQPVDLRQWIWGLVWTSSSFKVSVSEDDYFRLEFWPQPNSHGHRRDVFRMAACFQQGAQVSMVASKLNLPLAQVCQFVSAAVAAGFAP